MRTTPDPLAGPIRCDGCYLTIWWPRWAPDGNGEYYCLCERCYHRRMREFTAEGALHQAQAVVMLHHAILSGRVVRATGGAQ